MSTTTPTSAPVTGAAHQQLLATRLRDALGTKKPEPGRRVAAQILRDVRIGRRPHRLTAHETFATAAQIAARLASLYLRDGVMPTAVEHAHAERLLRERADAAYLHQLLRSARTAREDLAA